MAVAADAVFLAAHDHRDLGVGLEAEDAVDDMAAGFLEAAGMMMLFSSSKRALTSMSTVTCLPLRAASARAEMIGDLLETR